MGYVIPAKAFHADYNLKKQYGTYENYKAAKQSSSASASETSASQQTQETAPVENTTSTGESEKQQSGAPSESSNTLEDYISVENTGKLPSEEPKSAYETYMEKAKNIYNQGVEANNKNAANQAASALAEYRELNRNIGEINKANGRANTGYAGDTSIDAYNAYRNSVNKSYYDANTANNDLYSYYLSEMAELQQAKDTKEASDRQYEDQRAGEIFDDIETLKGENAYDSLGYITNETAERLWKYVTDIYGENIPNKIMASLNSEKGFSEWLEAYNSGDEYIRKHEYLNKAFECTIDGNKYILSTGAIANNDYSSVLDNMISGKRSPMKTAYYNGKLYIVDGEYNWREVISGESNINDALNAYKKVAQVK